MNDLSATNHPARNKPAGRRPGWGWRLARGTGRGAARGFLRFWPLWERWTLWLWHVQPVPGSRHGLFQVAIHPHKGELITLSDGTTTARGDQIMELHFVNSVLAAPEGGWSPIALLRAIQDDLAAIAAVFQSGSYPSTIRALYGVTLLARGAPRLGFTIRPRAHTLHGRLEAFFLKGLLALYNNEGLARLARGSATREMWPQEVWMSIPTLLARYSPAPAGWKTGGTSPTANGAAPPDRPPAHQSWSVPPATSDQTGAPTR
jgi:hypothetical protein